MTACIWRGESKDAWTGHARKQHACNPWLQAEHRCQTACPTPTLTHTVHWQECQVNDTEKERLVSDTERDSVQDAEPRLSLLADVSWGWKPQDTCSTHKGVGNQAFGAHPTGMHRRASESLGSECP